MENFGNPYCKHIKRAAWFSLFVEKIQKGLSKRLTLTEFIARSKKYTHGDNYNYSLVKYKGVDDTPVKIK